MNLFNDNIKRNAPLADRMRPQTLNEFIGQKHLLYKNSFLYRAIISNTLGSCIFFGPPGTGKTTIASIIANTVNANFVKLNAVSSGVAEAKEVLQKAKSDLELYGKKTFLLLDECHRWSKAQSDSLLHAIEQGIITFIGSTTENPYISMTRALVSRTRVFEFSPLTTSEVAQGLERALANEENGLGGLNIVAAEDVINQFAWYSGGDLRNAFNGLELAVATTPPNEEGVIVLTKEIASQCMQKNNISLDEGGYYDLLSAFGKSLRGSDENAALYYSQRLILSGVDPKVVARRLIAHASEDVGMADSNALLLANTALAVIEKLGLPEGNLALSHAIIYVALAPKSNSVYTAMKAAQEAVETHGNLLLPNHIKNHATGYGDGSTKYKYPHDFGGWVKQQYLPSEIKNAVFYKPSKNGKEQNFSQNKHTSG